MAEFEHYQTNVETQTDNLETELATLPDKFKGKTAVDIAKAYSELEAALSRQGQELGEYRRMVLANLEVEPKKAEVKPVPVDISADELLANPNKSLERAIEANPSLKNVVDRTQELERQLAQRTFETEHPKYKDDLNDTTFVDWVKKNPVRANLIQQANNYDLNSARALWGMWDEHRELVGSKTEEVTEATKRKIAEKAATLEGSTGSDATSEKNYSRAEFRELQRKALLGDKSAKAKWEDPAFRKARLEAYAEGRVK